jgi:hypothetical protein
LTTLQLFASCDFFLQVVVVVVVVVVIARGLGGTRARLFTATCTGMEAWCFATGGSTMGVREVFIVHVGCTRCVTSSTDNNLKIHARITLNVEFIRTCIFIFLFYV